MSSTSLTPIEHLRFALAAARRAILARTRRAALREAALIALSSLFVAVLVAARLENAAWQGPLVLAPTLLAILWWVFRDALARRRWASDLAVASEVEAVRHELRSDVRAALELGERPDVDDARTRGLREHLTQRVAAELQREGEGFPDLRYRDDRATHLGLSIALAALVLTTLWAAPERLAAGLGVLAYGPQTEGDQATEVVPEVMAVRNLDITATPPAYTERALRYYPGTSGSVRVIENSALRFDARIDRPVSSAELVLGEGDDAPRVALTVTEPQRVVGTIEVEESGRYFFDFVGPEGERFRDGMRRELNVEPDREPVITIESPEENLTVSPGDIVDIAYTVRDDYGINGVNLVWYFAGAEDDFRQLPLLGMMPSPSAVDTAPFDTAPLALQPGDEVIVQIEATDNDEIDGPNIARSRPISLVVERPDELNEEVFAAKERAFEAVLEQLAAMLEASLNEVVADEEGSFRLVPLEDTPEGYARRVNKVAEAHEEWRTPLVALQELVALARHDELTSPRELALLEGAYDRLYERERDEARLLENSARERERGAMSEPSFVAVANFQDEHIAETERVVLILESLIEEQQADQVARAIEELDEIRSRMRELFEEYEATGDPELRDQLLREINRLSQRMNELMERLQSQMQNLPQEFYNQEALDPSETAENLQNLGSSMEQMRDMLNRGDIDGARQAFEEMSSALDMMQQELGDPLANANPDELSEFDRQMGEIMDEVVDLEARESELERETAEFEEELRRERREEIAERLQRELQNALEAVRDERRRADALNDEELTSFNQEQLQSARASLESLERQLERQDVQESLDSARRALSMLNRAQNTLERALSYAPDGSAQERQARDGAGAMERSAQTVREVEEALRELQQAAQPQIGAAERQAMQELAQRQQEIQQGLEGLQQQIQQMGQSFPMMNEQFDGPLEATREGMGQAQRDLQGGSPRQAQDGQRQAISSLRGLRQQLQQQMSSRRQQQQRREGRGRTSERNVEVPEEGDQRTERREQIMEAMREGSLPGYEDQLREYYERLVQ